MIFEVLVCALCPIKQCIGDRKLTHASQDASCMAGQHVVEMVAVVNHSKEQMLSFLTIHYVIIVSNLIASTHLLLHFGLPVYVLVAVCYCLIGT